MSKKMADSFIGMYPVSKTLRFELKPIGKTLEHIEKDGIIDTDISRSEDYAKVKRLIDEYHKAFIQKVLGELELEGLDEYYRLYNNAKKSDREKQDFTALQEKLRKQIGNAFKADPAFKTIDKKELIKNDMVKFFSDDEEKLALISGFKEFTTYFTGFHQNRQNMYSDEAKSSSIAYRIVHQNLPKYIDNIRIFDMIGSTDIIDRLGELEMYLNDAFPSFGRVEDYFSVDNFNKVISQSGIDMYNTILGGYSEEDGKKIQGLNELVNLYCQKNKVRLPKFKMLFKQILSDRDSLSFIPESFSSDREVIDAVQDMYLQLKEEIIDSDEGISIADLFSELSSYDLNGLFISNDSTIASVSQELFGDWSIIRNAINRDYEERFPIGRMSREKYEEKKDRDLKNVKCYSISFLNGLLNKDHKETEIEKSFSNAVSASLEKIQHAYLIFDKLYKERCDSERKLKGNDRDISKIKELLDGFKELQWAIKPFTAGLEEANKDENFYGEFVRIWDSLNIVTPLYNMIRNYVTGKPYSTEKVKLNFNKTTLLNGWDKNQERDNLGIILLKDDNYFLGIINRNNARCMECTPKPETGDTYLKMNYKLLPGPYRQLPKVFFSKSRIDEFAPSDEVLRNYKAGTHKKGEKFNLKDCHQLIDFYKASIAKHKDWSQFDFHFSDTDTYSDINEFYREITEQGYKITFTDIDESYINNLINNGSLYLFQIYNKDFSPYSKGMPNLHTLYWKAVFSKENLEDVVYKLNGEAEVFYRKASIRQEDIIVHPADRNIINKDPLNEKDTSIFDYDIIKDRRFTCDKFFFHVPITMNYKVEEERYINQRVNRAIHDAEDIHIIGIDRGERNLLYLSVIDMDGKIVEQMSLNEILSYDKNRKLHRRDYHEMLTSREKEIISARQNWTTINTIKELKEGYLSQVIHVITELMIKYNAIVVLEDLNFGFKRGRQKFERQVYQKFEKMLIDKLNYYVDKQKEPGENGGLLKAWQLTAKFNSFQTLGKQSGFLYYVPAWNTSKIDPTTGFTNLLSTRYESIDKSRAFIMNMETIRYDNVEGAFAFSFDYERFTYKAEGTKTDWTIYTYGKRISHFRNKEKNNTWDTAYIDLTEEFSKLFKDYNISISEDDLKPEILDIQASDFYKRFMGLITMTLQMRNSDEEKGIDQIISPVKNSKGEFFVSGSDSSLPVDADANGAYNIAKKGLWIIRKIKETPEDKIWGINLALPNKEWLGFAQENTI